LSGIGGVVLLAGIVWAKGVPAAKLLPALGWWAFWLVQLQGLLGGLRVLLDAHEFAGMKLGVIFGIFHACLAQGFFVLLCVIAWMTGRRWWMDPARNEHQEKVFRALVLFTTILIFAQLALGATMRHQHAGLAISDFPLAHGQLWPATDPDSILRYNQQRMETSAANPITAMQVQLQMVHRIVALLIFVLVSACAGLAAKRSGWKSSTAKAALTWFGLILIQIGLGAATVLSNKAADIATAHVVVGVLSLAMGAMLCIFNFRSLDSLARATALSGGVPGSTFLPSGSVSNESNSAVLE
ncbi:MAG TPA: COX15/CtaA family protein, partial [Candidatus Paceibacterota bacterium]|nr:COX15/CtaA family protein [Candidatus Paceibacterota bacterium]